jgi:hypothetical protein
MRPIIGRLTRSVELIYVFARKDKGMKTSSYAMPSTGYNYISTAGAKDVRTRKQELGTMAELARCETTAVFPDKLISYLLDLYADKWKTVMDPFAGTGTTGISCVQREIDFVGVEYSDSCCKFMRNTFSDLGVLYNDKPYRKKQAPTLSLKQRLRK